MPFNFRFGVIMRYAGRRLPVALPELYTRCFTPHSRRRDRRWLSRSVPPAQSVTVPPRRTGLDAEDAVDPGHRRPHCRPVFKGTPTSSGSLRRQRNAPAEKGIPDQRPNPPAAVQQRPRHRAALLTGWRQKPTRFAHYSSLFPLSAALLPGLSPAIVTLLILLQPAAGRPGKMPGEPFEHDGLPPRHHLPSRDFRLPGIAAER